MHHDQEEIKEEVKKSRPEIICQPDIKNLQKDSPTLSEKLKLQKDQERGQAFFLKKFFNV